ncbi:hypothetical protein [Winogradskyella marina]|nr:hypothetical protein [Winogradskyella marina]
MGAELYLYPKRTVATDGKLRLLLDCNSTAFLTEQANGIATVGD